MNEQNTKWGQLYGSGWHFPLRFEPQPSSVSDSAVVMSSGVDNVAQSLTLLFQIYPGERIMRPEYGCDVQSAMFANLSEGTLSALRNRIEESVARHEPRAESVTVEMQDSMKEQGVLRILVTYRLAGQAQRIMGQLDLLEGMSGGEAWAIL